MKDSIAYLIAGVSFGLAAGFAPGPLLTLVISETIRHGKKHGILVALAPLLTDAPVIALSVYVLSKLASSDIILGIISLSGALFISLLAYENITAKGIAVDQITSSTDSLKKGVLANVLSPHPYLFWITVGSPILLKSFAHSFSSSLLFICGFYIFLVGSKILLALIADRSKPFLSSSAYVYILRALGLALLVFSILFLKEGLGLLGML
jgi:threonine/homoserine/homoserine lactone efflux protein